MANDEINDTFRLTNTDEGLMKFIELSRKYLDEVQKTECLGMIAPQLGTELIMPTLKTLHETCVKVKFQLDCFVGEGWEKRRPTAKVVPLASAKKEGEEEKKGDEKKPVSKRFASLELDDVNTK